MKIREGFDLCFLTRESWSEGSGQRTARINVNHCLRILGENLEVEDITSTHFAQISHQLLKEGKAKSTVNRITAVLSTMLSELRQNGYELKSVEYKRQKVKNSRPNYFKESEVDKILEVAKNENDYHLLYDSIVFTLKTGCRQGELLKLTADDIDIHKREILFRETKNGKDHWLKMHKDLIPILERRLKYRIDEKLFPWKRGDYLLEAFKKAMRDSGLSNKDKRVWHSLRHSVATWLCERQVPLRSVMGILNHSNVETTLRYAKASDKALAAAIDIL